MIDKISQVVRWSVDWWHGVISFMLNPVGVLTTLGVLSIIALFFILRWQLTHWDRMWVGEGILEIMVSGFIGLMGTIAISFVPLILWLTLACGAILIVATAFEKLVRISVRSK